MKKVTVNKNPHVNRNPSNGGGFGAGYMSYIKKSVRRNSMKIHVKTLYTIIIYKYIFLLIFNVTNVTPLVSFGITGFRRLRYNVTSWILLGV